MAEEIEVSIPEQIYCSLSAHKGELRTYDQLSQDTWGQPADKRLRQRMKKHFSNLRPGLDDEFIYTVEEIGAILSPLSPDELEEELTFQTFGASPCSPEEAERIRRNSLIEPPVVFKLMNSLNLEQVGKNRHYFRPHLPRCRRETLKSLAQGGLRSSEELVEASQIKSPDSLITHISQLRERLEPEGITIFHRIGTGYLLAKKPPDGEPFKYPNESGEDQPELKKRIRTVTTAPGQIFLHNLHLEGKEGSQLAIDLLSYIAETPNQCIRKKEIFEAVLGGDLDYNRKANLANLGTYLNMARKVLSKEAGKENWRLASIHSHNMVILCQGEGGKEVDLPGLYDLTEVPLAISHLLPYIQKGTIKERSTVTPFLTRTESAIFFKLAKTPGEPVKTEALEYYLWGDELYEKDGNTIRQHIRNLRRKLHDSGTNIKIETRRSLGYTLILENSQF